MKKLSVIIINYNTRDLLYDCVKNLLENTDPSQTEIIVADNGSTDNSAQMIKEAFPQVLLLEGENKGLAVAGNLGLKASSGEYLLYLGTDAYPKENDINGILDYMDKNPDVGMSTAKLVTRDGSLDLDAHRAFPTPWVSLAHFSKISKLSPKLNKYFLAEKLNSTEPHEIDVCISHFMMIRRSVFHDIKGWDEDYFVFGEDVDLCYRTKQAGWKIMYLPQFEVLHYKGGTIGRQTSKDIKNAASTSKDTKIRMQKERARAMRLFYQKHMKNKYPAPLNWLVTKGIDTLEFMRSSKI